MQPNKYQQTVLDDLRAYFAQWKCSNTPSEAYHDYWHNKGAVHIKPYHASLHNAPQICAKVPTAGGKTLIGIYALQEALNALEKRKGEPRLCNG